jgi:hypothetical protein
MHGHSIAAASSSGGAVDSSHWQDAGVDDADSSSSSFPEPLHVLCERVVAQQMVEPRTAPAILEYADVAGEWRYLLFSTACQLCMV